VVQELDPGIMALGLEPVIAFLRGDRIESDQQVRAAPGQPVLLRPAGISVPPGSRSHRPLRHIHHPFGLVILICPDKKIIAKNGLRSNK
jgi:hypothetical protein